MTTDPAASGLATPIVQFGSSRFLQAHADLFVDEAMACGQALGPITVVQTSGDPTRRKRLAALAADDGYPVRVEGLSEGTPVQRETRVRSVRRALDIAADFEEVVRVIVDEAEILISNTADAGYRPAEADAKPVFDPSMSFPAKLTHLLYRRFQANSRPIQVMPTELVAQNGAVLRTLVLALADHYPSDFRDWLGDNVRFVNSLVDRIVSEPIDPAGAVCEPYALWAIESCEGLVLPCTHPAMQVFDTLAPIEQLKLYILNLGHTYLVSLWLKAGRSQTFVRELIADPAYREALVDLYDTEVLPVFALAGMEEKARAYVATTLERFANPYLDHRLSDIFGNHDEKIRRRIGGLVDLGQSLGGVLSQPRLKALLETVP